MSHMDLTGIQTRTDSKGQTRFRPYVTDRGGKVFGSWTSVYADAFGWRVRALAAKLDGPLKAAETQTITHAAATFLAGAKSGIILSRKDTPYAPKTVRGYAQAFEDWIIPELGHIPVERLRRSQVQRWVDWLAIQRPARSKGTLAAGTIRNTWSALAALYTWLLPRHDDMIDPTAGVRLPRPGKPRERYADVNEMPRLVAALEPNLDLILPYAIAFYAGLRRAEIQALPLDMIDLDAGWLRVQYALDPIEGWKGPKSGAGTRDVPIFDALRPYLIRQLEHVTESQRSTPEKPGALLLPSGRTSKWGARMLGRPYTLRCERLWSSAGLDPIGLHEGRHSFATALVRAGYDIKTVQQWVGHVDPTMTLRIYAHEREREADAHDRMNAYLGA